MTGYEVFKLYHTLRLHFTTDYDFHKYGSKPNNKVAPRDKYETNTNKWMFEKVSNHYDERQVFGYILSNFVKDDKWFFVADNHEVYLKWTGVVESLPYYFKKDIQFLIKGGVEDFNDLFRVKSGHPKILRLVQQETITIESFILLNEMLNFFPGFDEHIDDEIIWPSWRDKCKNYLPFLDVDVGQYKQIAEETIHEFQDDRLRELCESKAHC